MESSRVLHSVLPRFFDYRVFHRSTSSNSSGEQISGQRYPSSSIVRDKLGPELTRGLLVRGDQEISTRLGCEVAHRMIHGAG